MKARQCANPYSVWRDSSKYLWQMLMNPAAPSATEIKAPGLFQDGWPRDTFEHDKINSGLGEGEGGQNGHAHSQPDSKGQPLSSTGQTLGLDRETMQKTMSGQLFHPAAHIAHLEHLSAILEAAAANGVRAALERAAASSASVVLEGHAGRAVASDAVGATEPLAQLVAVHSTVPSGSGSQPAVASSNVVASKAAAGAAGAAGQPPTRPQGTWAPTQQEGATTDTFSVLGNQHRPPASTQRRASSARSKGIERPLRPVRQAGSDEFSPGWQAAAIRGSLNESLHHPVQQYASGSKSGGSVVSLDYGAGREGGRKRESAGGSDAPRLAAASSVMKQGSSQDTWLPGVPRIEQRYSAAPILSENMKQCLNFSYWHPRHNAVFCGGQFKCPFILRVAKLVIPYVEKFTSSCLESYDQMSAQDGISIADRTGRVCRGGAAEGASQQEKRGLQYVARPTGLAPVSQARSPAWPRPCTVFTPSKLPWARSAS